MTERPLSQVLREKWDEQSRQKELPEPESPGAYWAEVHDRTLPPRIYQAAAPDQPTETIPGFDLAEGNPKPGNDEIVSRVYPMDDLPGLLADPCPWEYVAPGEYVNHQLGLTFKHEPGATKGVLTGPQHVVMGS